MVHILILDDTSPKQGLYPECKLTNMGKEYMGKISETETGMACLRWDSQPYGKPMDFMLDTPYEWHFLNLNVSTHENYCRNPGTRLRPWCFVSDKQIQWEYCKIPFCSDLGTFMSVENTSYLYRLWLKFQFSSRIRTARVQAYRLGRWVHGKKKRDDIWPSMSAVVKPTAQHPRSTQVPFCIPRWREGNGSESQFLSESRCQIRGSLVLQRRQYRSPLGILRCPPLLIPFPFEISLALTYRFLPQDEILPWLEPSLLVPSFKIHWDPIDTVGITSRLQSLPYNYHWKCWSNEF